MPEEPTPEKKKFPWPTQSGKDHYEVVSALQKSIRRGLEKRALACASDLYTSGYADVAWTRFLVIASEDIGLADPNVCVQIRTLHETWKLRKKEPDALLYFVHAVLILVRAPKSRIVDNALSCFFFGPPVEFDILDWALDKHTKRGKEMGRGMKHFFEESAKLVNCVLEDPYEEGAKKRRMAANGESRE